jgi:DNA-binding MarR family transcriptional regulator
MVAKQKRSAAARRQARQDVLGWVERVSSYYVDVYGMPPIMGRILAWLMICDPPEQNSAEIAAAVGASRASLTTNMQLLTASGLVKRYTRPGGRTAYFRMQDDAWEQVTRRRLAGLAAFRPLAQEGLALVGPQSERGRRIRAASDILEWTLRVFGKAATGPLK